MIRIIIAESWSICRLANAVKSPAEIHVKRQSAANLSSAGSLIKLRKISIDRKNEMPITAQAIVPDVFLDSFFPYSIFIADPKAGNSKTSHT